MSEPGPTADGRLLRATLQAAISRRDFATALQCTWDVYLPGLRALGAAAGLPPEEVDDLLQESVLRAARAWPGFSGDAFVPWLFAIVRYEMLTGRRRAERAGRRSIPSAASPERPTTPEEEAVAEQTARVLSAIQAGLDPVGVLLFETLDDDRNDEELALHLSNTLGFPTTAHAVQRRRYRLRKAIATTLAREDEP